MISVKVFAQVLVFAAYPSGHIQDCNNFANLLLILRFDKVAEDVFHDREEVPILFNREGQLSLNFVEEKSEEILSLHIVFKNNGSHAHILFYITRCCVQKVIGEFVELLVVLGDLLRSTALLFQELSVTKLLHN